MAHSLKHNLKKPPKGGTAAGLPRRNMFPSTMAHTEGGEFDRRQSPAGIGVRALTSGDPDLDNGQVSAVSNRVRSTLDVRNRRIIPG